MSKFVLVKGVNAEVLLQLEAWENKADDYVAEFFNDRREQVYGSKFGDNLAIIAEIREQALTSPEAFRGVRDRVDRLQAVAIVTAGSDYLEIDFMPTAPWNILQNRPESIKGAGTFLMVELVRESQNLGFGGCLKLYALPRAQPFYTQIGFVETEEGDWELTPSAAQIFLAEQRQLSDDR